MAKNKATVGRAKKLGAAGIPIRNVVPDRLDLRDRLYMPPVSVMPDLAFNPKTDIPVLNQGQTNACTGFALASVVYHLQHTAKREQKDCCVAPFMLYSMARRYDEFPGAPDVDTGSSLRGAMKGWYKHGACSDRLWPSEQMPTGHMTKSTDDWWLDAVQRPLGAYYRVDTRSVTDMHVALNEVGILYASAVCHSGWNEGFLNRSHRKGRYWIIPGRKASPSDGGHAFAIVGYNQDGFIIHNSWGTGWSTKGRAVLSYEDWLDHAMDCWVAQRGVVTELHLEIAHSTTLRLRAGKVQLASEPSLRTREISPFIIDMENNGRLSNTGDFRTQESDITALVTHHLGKARTAWGMGKNDPVDIAIYAHGGL
ncbi:MAG: C1 family peptidase, partial [Nitrospiraceae bacterium]